jgi:hypothetical protein
VNFETFELLTCQEYADQVSTSTLDPDSQACLNATAAADVFCCLLVTPPVTTTPTTPTTTTTTATNTAEPTPSSLVQEGGGGGELTPAPSSFPVVSTPVSTEPLVRSAAMSLALVVPNLMERSKFSTQRLLYYRPVKSMPINYMLQICHKIHKCVWKSPFLHN